LLPSQRAQDAARTLPHFAHHRGIDAGIRSTEPPTSIQRNIIVRLGAMIGRKRAALNDDVMLDLPVTLIEWDERWSCGGKKQCRVPPRIVLVEATCTCSSRSAR
jgi:hypothetical protein